MRNLFYLFCCSAVALCTALPARGQGELMAVNDCDIDSRISETAVTQQAPEEIQMDVPGIKLVDFKALSNFDKALVGSTPRTAVSSLKSRSRTMRPKDIESNSVSSSIEIIGCVESSSTEVSNVGINRIPIAETDTFTTLCRGVDATYGGVEIEGKYYCVDYVVVFSYVIPYLYIYDTSTWEQLDAIQLSNYSLMAIESAYDPVTGLSYGVFYNSSLSGFVLAKADYTTQSVTTICELENTTYCAIAADNDGTLYGIDISGYLKKIDKDTGDPTTIGYTGLTPYYSTSAAIDPSSGRLFYVNYPEDLNVGIYEVDKTTGSATLLTSFPDGEQIRGMYVNVLVEDKAPASVTDLSVSFTDGELTGYVNFTAPTMTADSTEATGEITYTILIDGVEAATGDTTYGSSVSQKVSVEDSGNYAFSVYASNSAGNGPTSIIRSRVGNDIPNAPENITATYADGSFSVNWDAVTSGYNGGYVDSSAVTYNIVRYPDNVTVANSTSSTSATSTVTEPEEITYYYFGVTASANGYTSQEGTSNSIQLGSIIVPPYSNEIDSETDVELFTTIDDNADGYCWEYYSGYMRCRAPTSSTYDSGDDWLITPGIKMQAGMVYELSFEFSCYNSARTQRIEVKCGSSATSTAMTETIIAATETTTRYVSGADILTGYISPSEDGIYYIGFHAISDVGTLFQYINNISISEGVNNTIPAAVSNLTATPYTDGTYRADISFTTPNLDYAGDTLQELTKIEILRDDEVVKTYENPTMSAEVVYTDVAETYGSVTYTIIPYNSSGAGTPASAVVYLGINVPAAVPAVYIAEPNNDGYVTITWDAPSSDIAGLALDEQFVTYDLYQYDLSTMTLIADDIAERTYSYQAIPSSDKQVFLEWLVYPSTESGTGVYTMSDLVPIGSTVSEPFAESFADATLSNDAMYSVIGSTASWTIYYDNYFSAANSVDGDNGFAGMYGAYQGSSASLDFVKVKVAEENPVFSFYCYKVADTSTDTYAVRVREPLGDWVTLTTIDMSDKDSTGWHYVTVSLSDYAGKVIQFGVIATSVSNVYHFIDNIFVGEILDHNLTAFDITAPETSDINIPISVEVDIKNYGANSASGYTVSLFRNDEQICTSVGETIEATYWTTVSFTDTLTAAMGDAVEYYATINYEADLDNSDNTTAIVTVEIDIPDYPIVTGLQGEKTAEGVSLTWDVPDMSITEPVAITDDFEDYEGFTSDIGDWTLIDNDGLPVVGLSSGSLPNIEEDSYQSYFVVDTEYPAEDITFDSQWDAYSGHKYIASLAGYELYSDNSQDDWAISPILYGGEQTISVYAKTMNYTKYAQSFYILYSTTGTDVDDFIQVAAYEEITNKWTKFTADLPDGAKYFAIRSYCTGQFMFLVDDVTYIPLAFTDLELVGYNVYRDGVRINESTITTNSFVDTTYDDSASATYMVTAVYNRGESRASDSITIEDSAVDDVTKDGNGIVIKALDDCVIIIGAENQTIAVTNPDGVVVVTVVGNEVTTIPLAKGLYIVSAANTVSKIIID